MATVISSSPPKESGLLERKRVDKFSTTEGTLYVSKPYRSKDSRKLRAMITFTPRKSVFDISNEASGVNEFRGFYTLFWVSIFIWTVRTYINSIEAHGVPLKLDFATMFSQDAITLAISDFFLVMSTGLCVPFAKALSRRWINYYWFGLALQHLLQTTILFTTITWTFNRKWPWVQSGFLTLHSLVMVMKMHSYLTVNGHLQQVFRQSKHVLEELQKATQKFGGWDQAMKDAKVTTSTETPPDTSVEPTRSGTPDVPEGSSSSYIDPQSANILRKRLAAMASHQNDQNESVEVVEKFATRRETTYSATISSSITEVKETAQPPQHPLISHPDPSLSALAKEYSDLQAELTSLGPEKVSWPNNVTWRNFAVYQLIPTLVYELEYPRTNQIRPLSLLDLALPFMMAYILLFYIIFECICNGFAELSYFADRQFYEDWYVHK
ncbi:hypothetical protein NP233_g7415 [Leucocoprinus birnbaumii]|uniref:O-acyltransferase n=1 Tax=Leucocoprinus birnbaumii TaxID=56174 RepID=A0AAD5YUM1_9AGAR|nr:hypothetical protein NP233_g7415 [Leucocoprinus birnbaumii]